MRLEDKVDLLEQRLVLAERLASAAVWLAYGSLALWFGSLLSPVFWAWMRHWFGINVMPS